MIRERYAIWNNKGGVGKSTITFHIASMYAKAHPDENVLVLDMCPQANATMMLLGSGLEGERTLIELENENPAPTIAGYITERLAGGLGNTMLPGGGSRYVIPASKFNKSMPGNLHIVPGDGNLELLAAPISSYAALSFPAGAWGIVHRWVRELIDDIAANGDQQWTVFIDTNPSFAVYTELAMVAADKLLVPFNADDSSRHAVSAIVRLLYHEGKANPVYDKFVFKSQAEAHGLPIPKLHMFVGNRFTQYKGSAKAFLALSDAVSNELFSIYEKNGQIFTERGEVAKDRERFMQLYASDVRDFNTAGVVAAHCGELLTNLSDGEYRVHDTKVRVHAERVEECVQSVGQLVAQL